MNRLNLKRQVLSTMLVIVFLAGCQLPASPPAQADFGDAPDPSFSSLLASNGARTLGTSQFWLGSLDLPGATLEGDAQITDLDEQDDGLVELLVADQVRITFRAAKSAQAPAGVAYFNLLADQDGDGLWEGSDGLSSEWIVKNQAVTLGPGETTLIEAAFPEFGGNVEVWVRATLTDSMVPGNSWDGTGEFAQGEVEDYRIGPNVTWDIVCDPWDPDAIESVPQSGTLSIRHGSDGAVSLFIDNPPWLNQAVNPPAEYQIVRITDGDGTGLLDDFPPPVKHLVTDPAIGDDFENIRIPILVASTEVHFAPGFDRVDVPYTIELKVKWVTQQPPIVMPTGVKTVVCDVVVSHYAPKSVIIRDGYTVYYTGPEDVAQGGVLEATFEVLTSDGRPAGGTFAASLGDPPSDPQATHASGELDAEGKARLSMSVKWPAGTTKLYISYQGEVYEVTPITINP